MNQPQIHDNTAKETEDNKDFFVQQFFLGCLAEFSYYIESNGEVAIIDPIRDIDTYLDLIKQRGSKLKYILETHLHADFVSGHLDLAKATGATIVYGPTAQTGFEIKQAVDGEQLPLGNINIRVVHTPGHTMESSCFILENKGEDHCIFTGDTLFLGEVGRPDLAVKSGEVTVEQLSSMLYTSLREKIMTLRNDIIIYPGHGSGSSCGKAIGAGNSCTLAKQKQSNYALQEMTSEEFTKLVLENMPKPPQYFFHDAGLNKSGPPDVMVLLSQSSKPLTYDHFRQLQKGSQIIDTRISVSSGLIDGAINITFKAPNFAAFVGSLIPPQKSILVIADKGFEQETVLRLLRIGYDNVMGYLQGGFEEYKTSGGATFQLTLVSLQEFVKGENKFFLDVRNPGEFKEGIFPEATCIPFAELQNNLEKVPKEKTIHVYCKTGGRAKIAASILRNNGYENIVITEQGGLDAILAATGIAKQ